MVSADRELCQLRGVGTASEGDFEEVRCGVLTVIAFHERDASDDWVGRKNATFFHDLETASAKHCLAGNFGGLGVFVDAKNAI